MVVVVHREDGSRNKKIAPDKLRGFGSVVVTRRTEVMARVRVIRNTVEPDPNMPTLQEVRALLDEPIVAEEVADETGIDE